MDEIIADICRESVLDHSLHNQSQLVIKQLKESGLQLDLVHEASLVLRLSKLCIESKIKESWSSSFASRSQQPRLPHLGLELLRVYVRHLASVSMDNHDEGLFVSNCSLILRIAKAARLITKIVLTIESIIVSPSHTVRPELLSIFVELTTSFSSHMTISSIITIVHLCAYELANHYRALTNHSSSATLFSLFNLDWPLSPKTMFANTSKKALARRLNTGDDKTMATICMVAGQVCHFYIKLNICRLGSSRSSSSSSKHASTSSSSKHASTSSSKKHLQDLTHLLIYLSKKLETKICFFHENDQQNEAGSRRQANQMKLFVQLKLLNCYHLKCIHYVLLTIPDAWQSMTTQIMDVVSGHLAPPLVSLITPRATESSAFESRIEPHARRLGRGAQSLRNTAGFDDELAEQERQLVYKISVELLRLFGLEESMRPLLEALFYRLFLLPPHQHRKQVFVYMQEMLKNNLVVLLLISDPICLFGPSRSRSHWFALLQIMLDAIKQAILEHTNNPLGAQQALVCWATLLHSLQNILAIANKNGSTTLLAFPIVVRLLQHVARNQQTYQTLKNLDDCRQVFACKPAKPVSVKMHQQSVQNQDGESNGQIDKAKVYYDRLFALIRPSSSGASGERECPKRAVSLHNLSQVHDDFQFAKKKTFESWLDAKMRRAASFDSFFSLLPAQEVGDVGEDQVDDDGQESSVFDSAELSDADDPPASRQTIKSASLSEATEEEDESESLDEANAIVFNLRTFFDGHSDSRNSGNISHLERCIARIFFRHLQQKLVDWLESCNSMTIVRLDEEIQRFASQFCGMVYGKLCKLDEEDVEGVEGLDGAERAMFSEHKSLFVNGDGIYLTIYQVFLLSSRLEHSGFYGQQHKAGLKPCMSESRFVKSVLSCGNIVHLSSAFLAEVYQQVLQAGNLLAWKDADEDKTSKTLFLLIQDIEVIHTTRPLDPCLSDYARLEKIACHSFLRSPSHVSIQTMHTIDETNDDDGEETIKPIEVSKLQGECLRLIIRRACHYFWATFLVSLEQSLDVRGEQTMSRLVQSIHNVSYIASVLKVLNLRNRAELSQLSTIDACIELMAALYSLSINVDYLDRMHTLYDVFLHFVLRLPSNEAPSAESSSSRSFLRLTPIQVKVIKMFVVFAARVGAHQPSIWPAYLSLARFLSQHETILFRSTRSNLLSRARVSINCMLRSKSLTFTSENGCQSFTCTRENGSKWKETFGSMYDLSELPGVHEAHSLSLETEFDRLVASWQCQTRSTRELDERQMEVVYEYLSSFVVMTFETLAVRYNLASMIAFVCHLVDMSTSQLGSTGGKDAPPECIDAKTIGLNRLVEVALRFIRTGRPLVHFMRLWPLVAEHLVQVATLTTQPLLLKRVLSALHDIMNATITMYTELDYFHFNEMIFTTYERLMWGKADLEVQHNATGLIMQEMLVNSICEFVEGANNEIRSGWRSIFRALGAFRLVDAADGVRNSGLAADGVRNSGLDPTPSLNVLTDILSAFLLTANSSVFAHVSVDYIHCLLHLLKLNITEHIASKRLEQLDALVVVFLKHLQRFAKLLREQSRQALSSFALASNLPHRGVRWVCLESLHTTLIRGLVDDQHCQFSFNISLNLEKDNTSTGIARLWLVMLDEFASTILASPVEHRQMQLEVFISLLDMTPDVVVSDHDHGSENFTLRSYNQVVLPMMQDFLHESIKPNSSANELERLYTFYNTWLKVFNEMIIALLLRSSETPTLTDSCNLLLKQVLLIYIECFTPGYADLIKVMAMSSLRILLSWLAPMLCSSSRWEVLIDCFKIGHHITLWPLARLMHHLDNVPFDLANELTRLKILAMRTERNACSCMRRLARTIFCVHLDNDQDQSKSAHVSTNWEHLEDDRMFTIQAENDAGIKQSFMCNELVAQLYLHFNWTQAFCTLLTSDLTSCRPADLIDFLGEYNAPSHHNAQASPSHTRMLLLRVDQLEEIHSLLSQTFRVSTQFDRRSGLKVLLQFVTKMDKPANLYHLTALVWSSRFSVAYHLHHQQEQWSMSPLLQDIMHEFMDVYHYHYDRLDVARFITSRMGSHLNRPFALVSLGEQSAQQALAPTDQCEENDGQVNELVPLDVVAHHFRTAKTKLLQKNTSHLESSLLEACTTLASEPFQLDTLLFLDIANQIIARCLQINLKAEDLVFRKTAALFQELVHFCLDHPSPSLGSAGTDRVDPKVEQVKRWINRIVQFVEHKS